MSRVAAFPAAAKVRDAHALWVGKSSVLEVSMDPKSTGYPPAQEHSVALNTMVQGLARALRSVVYHAEHDASSDAAFLMQPVEDIADAIVLLTQLSGAVQQELHPEREP